MVQLRHLNYLIIAFFTSGISLSCSNHVNSEKIESMNLELERLRDENESLRKEVKPNPTLKSIVSELDDCLTILMREIMENDIDGVMSSICTFFACGFIEVVLCGFMYYINYLWILVDVY